MKPSKFSDAQKAYILKQGADGMPVAEICRKAGISSATYFNWKKKYDGLLPTDMRRLKHLEDENAKLRKVVADFSLSRQGDAAGCPPPKTLKPVRTRRLVDEVRGTWGVSICRTCGVLEVDTLRTTTNLVAAARLILNCASKRFVKPGSVTDISGSMCCCVARDGTSIIRRHAVSTAS